MIEEGIWVTSKEAVHSFAVENDGECVIARAKYFEDHGATYATCCFTSPDEARTKDCGQDWDWYFTDEPYIDEKWKLEGNCQRKRMIEERHTLVGIQNLLHPEFYSPKRVYSLYRKIQEDGIWTAALYVDDKYNIVLDGQHRLEVAKLMDLKRVPVIFFDLESKKTRIWSEKGKEKINKKLLIKRAQGYDPYPYKSIDFDHADKYDGNACRVGFDLLR